MAHLIKAEVTLSPLPECYTMISSAVIDDEP